MNLVGLSDAEKWGAAVLLYVLLIGFPTSLLSPALDIDMITTFLHAPYHKGMLVASRNIQCQEQGCSFVAARRQVIMQHYSGLMTTNRLHQVPAPGPSDTAKHALIYLQKAAAVRVATL